MKSEKGQFNLARNSGGLKENTLNRLGQEWTVGIEE